MKQLPLAIAAAPEAAFHNFVVGANEAALEYLQAAAPEPVYLWGPSGCGKTHLLQALAADRQHAGERVGWLSAGQPVPWHFDPGWSLVVIDNCDALDPPHQQAAFAIFVEAATHGVRVAAAGRLPPVDLPLRDDLRTRLGWGPVFAIEPLSDEQARAALRREAERRGIFLADEVMDYLLSRFARDLKNLMALLDRLDDYALERQRAVTVPLLRQMLAEERTPS